MKFLTQKLPNGRWGIYKELQLMATVGDSRACDEIINCLKSFGNRKPKQIDLLSEFSDDNSNRSNFAKNRKTIRAMQNSA